MQEEDLAERLRITKQVLSIRLKQLGNVVFDLCNKILNLENKEEKTYLHLIVSRF